jgi:nitrogen fixation/metabolism regulation signal transduction histidine kinase
VRLRRRLLVYLVVLHLVFAALALLFLGDHRLMLLGVEALFVISFAVALGLLRHLFEPLDMLRSAVAQLRDSDFITRFRPSGQTELDGLVDIYNQMADRLREERTRQQEQNAFLERVLAASPAGIIVLDFDARIASANPAARRMLGVAAPNMSGPATNGDAAAWIGRTLAEQDGDFARALSAVPEGEARVLGLHGSRRIKCQRAHFMDRGFRRDFLVLEELTEEVRRAEKSAYDKLIRMMSHEVNNTTAAVASLLSACLAYRDQVDAADREEFTTALEIAIGRTRSLSGFMNDFADVVRLPAPRRARPMWSECSKPSSACCAKRPYSGASSGCATTTTTYHRWTSIPCRSSRCC